MKSLFFLTAAIRFLTESRPFHSTSWCVVNSGRMTLKSLGWTNHLGPSKIQALAELPLVWVQVWHANVWFRAWDWIRTNHCRQHCKAEKTNSDIQIKLKKFVLKKEGLNEWLFFFLLFCNEKFGFVTDLLLKPVALKWNWNVNNLSISFWRFRLNAPLIKFVGTSALLFLERWKNVDNDPLLI